MDYILHIIIIINIYIILVISTNLLVGITGLLSLGQAAFYGISAYLTAFAVIYLKLSFFPAIIFVIFLTAITGLILAYPSLRLKGDYFILATMGFQLIVFTILYNWVSVTKGSYGISGIQSPNIISNIKLDGLWSFFIFSSILSSIVILIFFKLVNSPFGRILKGIRDDEIIILSIGKNITNYKIWAFVISSGFISFAGFIFATYISYIDPTSFTLNESIFIMAAVIIGGTGNIKGSIAGAIFVILLPELLRFIGLPDSIAANLRQIIYGLLIILIMRFRPQGILGDYKL
jgi:branched-chain amino acid transport system permease protein